jgi:hypothetical protein
LLERDVDQIRARLGGAQIEHRGPIAKPRPPRAAGIALAETAVGLADSSG